MLRAGAGGCKRWIRTAPNDRSAESEPGDYKWDLNSHRYRRPPTTFPNPVRSCMFIDTGATGSRPAELVNPPRECSLTNAAGGAFWRQCVYKHATPDGVGNVGRGSSVS